MKAKNVLHPAAVDPRTAVYHLKVHILSISPMIYRRFIIDGNTHLAELHHLIGMIMGWENRKQTPVPIGKTQAGLFFQRCGSKSENLPS